MIAINIGNGIYMAGKVEIKDNVHQSKWCKAKVTHGVSNCEWMDVRFEEIEFADSWDKVPIEKKRWAIKGMFILSDRNGRQKRWIE